MRMAWTPATPATSTSPSELDDDMTGRDSWASCTSETTVSRKGKHISTRGSPTSEMKALRAEVLRLRTTAQREAQERESLVGKIELLKAELRNTLEQNRSLADSLEERRRICADEAVEMEVVPRDSALESAKDLFKQMLGEESRAPKWRSGPNVYDRRPASRLSSSPPSPTFGHPPD
mmetsp:Transcript_56445/g.101187  ORF Transcript_56445/g.101187 Transcript_56445/m.101187 type:complete len:177 (-) Transcript_56445:81-611(-)